MAFSMKAKCDKYWGDPQKMNLLIFIATVLDPREIGIHGIFPESYLWEFYGWKLVL